MAKPLTDAITALTTYANTVTGASDTDLSSAVATLANGYGQGGSDDFVAWLNNTLESYENDNLTNIPAYGFYQRTALKTISFPNATMIGTAAFNECTSLENVNLPKIQNVEQNSFRNCSKLPSISFLALAKELRNYCFDGCSGAVTARLPSFCRSNTGTFRNCTKLASVDLGKSTLTDNSQYMGAQQFSGCSLLSLLILRNPKVLTIGNINTFNGTPFASNGTGGTLYVPQSLISSYQSASNWSTILGYANNQILPIEGSIYETQYADGTPIE